MSGKNQQLVAGLVIGVLIGFLIGAVIIGNNDNFREDLFGTAGVTNEEQTDNTNASTTQLVYYEIELSEVNTWLEETFEEELTEEDFETTVEDITFINTLVEEPMNSTLTQEETEETSQRIMEEMTKGLVRDPEVDLENIRDEYSLQLCLGYEEDLYDITATPVSYVSMEIPADEVEGLNLTEDYWVELAQPKSTYWTILYCYE